MATEYSTMMQVLALPTNADQMGADALSMSLVPGFQRLVLGTAKALQIAPGGPWRMVSHSTARMGNKLLVTFVISHEV